MFVYMDTVNPYPPVVTVICRSCGASRRALNPKWARFRRKQEGLTLKAAAAGADLALQTLNAFESGLTNLSTAAGCRLLAVLRETGVELG